MEYQKNLHFAGIKFREISKYSRNSRKLAPAKISTIKVDSFHGQHYNKNENENISNDPINEEENHPSKVNMQLINVRSKFHQNYLESKLPDEVNGNSTPKSRILIASDSMMNQIDENRLSRIHEIKVVCWGGCNIPQMHNNLDDILERELFEVVIVHVGTNDSAIRTSDDMMMELMQLKQYI